MQVSSLFVLSIIPGNRWYSPLYDYICSLLLHYLSTLSFQCFSGQTLADRALVNAEVFLSSSHRTTIPTIMAFLPSIMLPTVVARAVFVSNKIFLAPQKWYGRKGSVLCGVNGEEKRKTKLTQHIKFGESQQQF